ncbi:PREDICTED: LOC107620598 isoform [Prunus dulcis]|uniref:PREDICTED: LOC107620598 isoform n=1 Tax=Prunus dulcis TaxID=3755 RepID=A0A5E4G828_PRUDU|nr:PREDICTED: LOC107620598 isoform [Prunus dulcis]
MGFLGVLLTPTLEKLDTIYPEFGSESRNVRLGLAFDGFNPFDVYLQPLINELKTLWVHGLLTFDAFKQETFIMCAAVMWTINDFLVYDVLFSWSIERKKACPNCAYGTNSLRLKHGKKFVTWDSVDDCRSFISIGHILVLSMGILSQGYPLLLC